jgi:hypothetical protein
LFPPIARHHDRRVADDEDLDRRALEQMALGDATHLLFYGTASASIKKVIILFD